MFIMMIILTAFLCGMNNIYVYYQESEQLGRLGQLVGLGRGGQGWLGKPPC